MKPIPDGESCNLEGCEEKTYCAELTTYRHDNRLHEINKFCSLNHLAVWSINQSRRERLGRRAGPSDPRYLDKIEELVMKLVYDKKFDDMDRD